MIKLFDNLKRFDVFLSILQAKVFISSALLTLFVSLSSRAHTDCPYLFLKNSLPHCFGEVAVLRQRDGIIDIFFGVSTFFLFFFSLPMSSSSSSTLSPRFSFSFLALFALLFFSPSYNSLPALTLFQYKAASAPGVLKISGGR